MCFRTKSDQLEDDVPQEIPKVIITRASTDREIFGDDDVEIHMEHAEKYVGKRKQNQSAQRNPAKQKRYRT
ncbi:hypothetical protein DPV78_002883 [Talaromyces pinophilus]|nr:hypothetical protein DPV78_002883 [Talaromyces pinophilus]